MSFTAFVGNRISLKSNTRRASAGVVIAVTGIAVSYIIMLLAIAIVSGFKNEIVKKLTGFNPPISITAPPPVNEADHALPASLTPELRSIIQKAVPGSEPSVVVNQPTVLKTDSAFQGLVLHGMAPGAGWDFVKANLAEGTVPTPTDSMAVVLSASTASALALGVGSSVDANFFDGNSLRTRRLKVTGIYDSHFNDFDQMMAYAPIGMLRQLLSLDTISGSSIELHGIEFNEINDATNQLSATLLSHALDPTRADEMPMPRVDNMLQQCAMYINWLNLLDTNVVVILVLMAAVSGFTLISSLFIIILEKVNMIGLFKALGATNGCIRKIFIFIAQRLVIKGLVIGNIIGLAIILFQRHTHLLPLNPDAYYLNFVPMELSWPSVIVLNIAVIVVATSILIIPSCLISSISPVKSLKYE